MAVGVAGEGEGDWVIDARLGGRVRVRVLLRRFLYGGCFTFHHYVI